MGEIRAFVRGDEEDKLGQESDRNILERFLGAYK